MKPGLRRCWSPEQIAGRLRLEHPDDPYWWVSHETIYKSLYLQGRGGLDKELRDALRTGRARRRSRDRVRTGYRSVKDMVMISERPHEVEDRAVPGHWEGDLLIGTNRGSSQIGVLVERTSRFVMLVHLPESRKAETVRDATARKIGQLPKALTRTLTWDQGHEIAEHARFTVDTGVEVFFCDPHSHGRKRHRREHQPSSPPIPPQRSRLHAPTRSRPRPRRRRTQPRTTQNPQLPDTHRDPRPAHRRNDPLTTPYAFHCSRLPRTSLVRGPLPRGGNDQPGGEFR